MQSTIFKNSTYIFPNNLTFNALFSVHFSINLFGERFALIKFKLNSAVIHTAAGGRIDQNPFKISKSFASKLFKTEVKGL